jgi:hypothetical protein
MPQRLLQADDHPEIHSCYSAIFDFLGSLSETQGRIKPLLFAPRLMLERGLQFTRRRSRTAQRRPITPFQARLYLPKSQMKPAQSRLILPRIINA